MNDPETELSERERRQDSDPIDWGTDIPFQGESVPRGMPADRRPVTLPDGSDAASMDGEVMAFDDWRVLWTVTTDGALAFV